MIDLDELERLEREATAGPWESIFIRDNNGAQYGTNYQVYAFVEPSICGSYSYRGGNKTDLDFISALRNAARDLIADARRYRWLLNEIDRVDVPPLGRVVWKQRDDRESHLWCDFATSQEVSAAIDAAINASRGKE